MLESEKLSEQELFDYGVNGSPPNIAALGDIPIRSGLTGSERVIRAPGPDVVEGLAVQVAS